MGGNNRLIELVLRHRQAARAGVPYAEEPGR